MENLILEWQKRQQKYEELAKKYKHDVHNNRKFTYKAMATRDCWKELALQFPQVAVMQSVLKNQVRIGNLVDFNGKVETVYSIRNTGVDFYIGKTKKSVIMQSYVWEAIKPIPLTEEWLFKLGFINDRVLEFYRNDITDSTIIIDYNFICLLGYSHVKLNYVHELQNLYFALTQRELNVA